MSQSYLQLDQAGKVMSYVGPDATRVFQLKVLASGLELYAKTKLRPGYAWTPTRMLRAASRETGAQFRRGQYNMAAMAVRDLLNKLQSQLEIRNSKGDLMKAPTD